MTNALALTAKKQMLGGLVEVDESVPAFMRVAENQSDGTEGMGGFLRPPRIKIVQKQSDDTLREQFEDGTVLCVTAGAATQLAAPGESFLLVPIYFWPTWERRNPLGKKPFIIERTLDPKHDIAIRSRDLDTSKDDDGVTYVESLNFVVVPLGAECAATPMLLSFAKGQHRDGTAWIATIKMRRGVRMMGNCFEAFSEKKDNGTYTWQGFNIANPSNPDHRYVDDEELFNHFQELHEFFKSNISDLDYTDEESAVVDEAAAEM